MSSADAVPPRERRAASFNLPVLEMESFAFANGGLKMAVARGCLRPSGRSFRGSNQPPVAFNRNGRKEKIIPAAIASQFHNWRPSLVFVFGFAHICGVVL